ncbi:MAG: uracil phosphoribosyltransferase [Elusimicrobiales bacterium]|nr:uracil phosphoribosyltransferase [Elusimicrobiales bacterium]
MLHISKHPLVMEKIRYLRDKNTPSDLFRRVMKELSILLTYEVTSDFPTKELTVRTPLDKARVKVISKEITVVGILRAGLAMMEGISEVIPFARFAHIGIYRDEETLKPVKYYLRLPFKLSENIVIIVDPMLATGGSALEAINIVKSHGAKSIYFMSAIASRYGIDLVEKYHPDVKIFIAALDMKLNSHGYIVPGLGDAGDRMFKTSN